jgi:hypothetical protein
VISIGSCDQQQEETQRVAIEKAKAEAAANDYSNIANTVLYCHHNSIPFPHVVTILTSLLHIDR